VFAAGLAWRVRFRREGKIDGGRQIASTAAAAGIMASVRQGGKESIFSRGTPWYAYPPTPPQTRPGVRDSSGFSIDRDFETSPVTPCGDQFAGDFKCVIMG